MIFLLMKLSVRLYVSAMLLHLYRDPQAIIEIILNLERDIIKFSRYNCTDQCVIK